MDLLVNLDCTHHCVGNVLIGARGKDAVAETYFHAYHALPSDAGQPTDLVVGGRYLDEASARDGTWRLSRRTVLVDWFRQYDDHPGWKTGVFGYDAECVLRGRHGAKDFSYELLGPRR